MNKFRIEIDVETGEIHVYADNGTFQEKAPQIAKIFTALSNGGIKFESMGEVERHNHDDPAHRLLHDTGIAHHH